MCLKCYGYCFDNIVHKPTYLTQDMQDCNLIEVISDGPAGIVQWDMMGYYKRKPNVLNGKPIFQHKDYKLFLYYLKESDGYWIIGEDIGEDVGGIQNDSCDEAIIPAVPVCKGGWMFGDKNETWQEDTTIKLVCKSPLNEVCHSADCSKPSVSVLCADVCNENHVKALATYLDESESEETNGSIKDNFPQQFSLESQSIFWKYFEDTPIFFLTSSIVTSAIISFQAGGIVIALALKYFENNESYKPLKLQLEIPPRNKRTPTLQWKNLKMLQKERSLYLKQKYVKKWKYMKNGDYIWMNTIPE